MNQLTQHQQDVLDEILSMTWYKEPNIVLKGSAGVGKTFLVGELIKRLPGKVMCSAPTHKALSVIRAKVKAHLGEDLDEDYLQFETIHKALQYKMVVSEFTGDKIFLPAPSEKFPPLKGYSYWIIDEASMVDSVMLENIQKYAKLQKCCVIYIGDEKQINPVDEEDSPVFMQDFPGAELTEIIRQGAGNPIIELSRNLRQMWNREEQLSSTEPMQGIVYTMNLQKIVQELAKVNGTDEMKYLAWSNTEVDAMNVLVRREIYGENPDKIEIGETIVFNSPYKVYTTNQELKVNTVEHTTITREVIVKNKPRPVKEEAKFDIYLVNGHIEVLKDSSVNLFKRYLSTMNKNCKEGKLDYRTKVTFADSFADFKYNHALTVHKSQGSTYKQAILNVKNINFNPRPKEKTRLFYTGVTRASDLLILYNV